MTETYGYATGGFTGPTGNPLAVGIDNGYIIPAKQARDIGFDLLKKLKARVTSDLGRRVYVAGPMTGLKDFNFPAFFEASDKLRAEGYAPINPAQHDIDSGYVEIVDGEYKTTQFFDLQKVLLWDLQQVAYADTIYLLNGWEKSKGARAEHALAVALGKEILSEPVLPDLIGLGGLLRSGKDTFADYLVEGHGYVKLNMSEPLHEAMMTLDPIVNEGYDHITYSELIGRVGYTEAKKNPEVRRLLQVLGTEIGRKMFGENVWVDLAGKRIDELRAEGKPVVITGLRYPNEIEMIRSRKGRAAWVDRGGKPTSDHPSENSVKAADFDFAIDNTGSLNDLYATADFITREN